MIRSDVAAFRRINKYAGRYPWLDAAAAFFAHWTIFLMYASVFVAAAIAARNGARGSAAAFTVMEIRGVVAGVTAFTVNWVFSLWMFRRRPYVALKDVRMIIAHPITAHSFPSGHSSAAFALAFTVLFFSVPFGLALLVGACIVGISRVFVGVHYPLDVIAGVFVGLFWALVFLGLGTGLHDLDVVNLFFERHLQILF